MPVRSSVISAVDELAWMFAGEVLPRPFDDGFELGACDRQQG